MSLDDFTSTVNSDNRFKAITQEKENTIIIGASATHVFIVPFKYSNYIKEAYVHYQQGLYNVLSIEIEPDMVQEKKNCSYITVKLSAKQTSKFDWTSLSCSCQIKALKLDNTVAYDMIYDIKVLKPLQGSKPEEPVLLYKTEDIAKDAFSTGFAGIWLKTDNLLGLSSKHNFLHTDISYDKWIEILGEPNLNVAIGQDKENQSNDAHYIVNSTANINTINGCRFCDGDRFVTYKFDLTTNPDTFVLLKDICANYAINVSNDNINWIEVQNYKTTSGTRIDNQDNKVAIGVSSSLLPTNSKEMYIKLSNSDKGGFGGAIFGFSIYNNVTSNLNLHF